MLDKCWFLAHGMHIAIKSAVHPVAFVVKGKRGEEGPRGKQGSPVSK